jgi:hypothetical protein
VYFRVIGAAVMDGDLHQDVVRRRFSVFDLDIEIAIAVENTRVEQLVLGIVLARDWFVATKSL